MTVYGIWCEKNKQWLARFPNCVCNMFVNNFAIALAIYNYDRNERARIAQRGGYFGTSDSEQEKRETQKRYEAEWLEAGYSVRQLGDDGYPTAEILAAGPLEIK